MTQKKDLIVSTSILVILILVIVGALILTNKYFVKNNPTSKDTTHVTTGDTSSIPIVFHTKHSKEEASKSLVVPRPTDTTSFKYASRMIHDSSCISIKKSPKSKAFFALDTTDTITITNKWGEVLFKGTFNDHPRELHIVNTEYNKNRTTTFDGGPDTASVGVRFQYDSIKKALNNE